jgi:hypothetical protein
LISNSFAVVALPRYAESDVSSAVAAGVAGVADGAVGAVGAVVAVELVVVSVVEQASANERTTWDSQFIGQSP